MRTTRPNARALGGLSGGVLAISTAAVLIRLAASPPLTVTAWRLTIAGLIYILVYTIRARRAPWTGLGRQDLLLAAGAALALALHFVAWIASLGFTSVVSSVVLLTTAPIWVAIGQIAGGGLVLAGVGLAISGERYRRVGVGRVATGPSGPGPPRTD